jgi:hypothetical protein
MSLATNGAIVSVEPMAISEFSIFHNNSRSWHSRNDMAVQLILKMIADNHRRRRRCQPVDHVTA